MKIEKMSKIPLTEFLIVTGFLNILFCVFCNWISLSIGHWVYYISVVTLCLTAFFLIKIFRRAPKYHIVEIKGNIDNIPSYNIQRYWQSKYFEIFTFVFIPGTNNIKQVFKSQEEAQGWINTKTQSYSERIIS